ncbi:hypothetical protein DM48_331 [Burkholderia gladioli]|uniref:DUF3601 domain-containing protein n=1 Tax=Burkholderia gladioli TaxID=28095 RepID=A0AAW3EYW0_BURGA|nr:hypothetical protein [Burkholderia gladioli]KGC13253.1 hypothetical protein DM48_331 [Burkholderia gladioli]
MTTTNESSKHVPYREIDRGTMHGIKGEQKIYRFDNGYGASVVRGYFTYGGEDGKWELGVVTFGDDTWHLDYSTPITNDVLGHLQWHEVEEILDQIAALPKVEA